MGIILPKIDHQAVEKEIVEFIKCQVFSMKKDGVVIGVSGGIDSAVTAILCHRAFGNCVTGLILPGDFQIDNVQDSKDARNLCEKFGINYYEISLKNEIESHYNLLNAHIPINKTAKGNMASRIRSNILHTFAEATNSLVCGTGNKDEDYGIGYYTLFGDGAVHMSPIGKLSKRLVYQMGEYLGVPENILKKAPSARLEDGQTDFGDLGYGYDIVEMVIEAMDQDINDADMLATLEKMSDIKYDTNRFKNIEEVVDNILDRHILAIYKANLVCPESPNILMEY